MSTRRASGDLVMVSGHWCGDLPGPAVLARIIGDDAPEPWCFHCCGDVACQEWPNVEIIEGEHAGQVLYHVSECQMADAPEAVFRRPVAVRGADQHSAVTPPAHRRG